MDQPSVTATYSDVGRLSVIIPIMFIVGHGMRLLEVQIIRMSIFIFSGPTTPSTKALSEFGFLHEKAIDWYPYRDMTPHGSRLGEPG